MLKNAEKVSAVDFAATLFVAGGFSIAGVVADPVAILECSSRANLRYSQNGRRKCGYFLDRASARNSSRVCLLWRNAPSIALVHACPRCFLTPRLCMQRLSASMVT